MENAFYTADIQGPYEMIGIGDLELEEGGVLPDVHLAVAAYGTLNEAKDNAILVPTWFSGTHQTYHDIYIGPQHALNPDKYFIIVVNQIGNGLSTSPHHANNAEDAAAFPHVRIGDDVVAQERLLREHFGISELALVVGGSMGAQQTWEWAVRFPEKVKRAAPIAGTAQNTPHDFLFTRTLMEAITSDPGFAGGRYGSNAEVADGLARHARIWGVVGLSTEFWKTGGYRLFGFDSMDACLDEFMVPLFQSMDPNALLSMGWKWQRGDVARHTGGDLAAAMSRVTAKVFALPIDEDMFFPPRDVQSEQVLVANSELRVLRSLCGHFGLFGAEPEFMQQLDQHLFELLETKI